MPIVAITPQIGTARQLHGSWGIEKIFVSPLQDIDSLCTYAAEQVKAAGLAKSGDAIVVMAGSESGGASITDTVRMVVIH